MTAKSFFREGAIVWWLGWARLRSRLGILFLILGGGVLAVWLQNGWDDRLLQTIRITGNDRLNYCAHYLNYWGDWPWSLLLVLSLWLGGVLCRRKRWRQLGWSCFWAFLIMAVTVSGLRISFGRARPYVEVPDGFHGPTLSKHYHGFPSGHAAGSFATAAAVASAPLPVSLPCAAYAAIIGWSRLQLNRHRPLDVLTGAALGGFVGLCFASAVPGYRWRLRRK